VLVGHHIHALWEHRESVKRTIFGVFIVFALGTGVLAVLACRELQCKPVSCTPRTLRMLILSLSLSFSQYYISRFCTIVLFPEKIGVRDVVYKSYGEQVLYPTKFNNEDLIIQ
jgi:hypothetical protein